VTFCLSIFDRSLSYFLFNDRLDRGHKVHQVREEITFVLAMAEYVDDMSVQPHFLIPYSFIVVQVSEEDKKKVSSEAARAARNMAKKALQERLDSIEMSKSEWDMYRRFVDPIQQDIASLRAILSQVMETRKSSSERGWMKRQSHGELDDTKLVDSVTGDKYVYKRRGTITPNDPTTKRRRPKRLRFVVDVSGSMYRFNGYDERLIRCLEATNLVMESFSGLEGHEFDYSIVGHSGDSPCIPLVDFGKPPATEKDRMKVLQTMVAHSQFCQSGDHTLEAMEQAMMDVVERSGLGYTTDDFGDGSDDDECIVIAISDANLQRYGIHPRELGKIMQQQKQQGIRSSSTTTNSSSVKAYCIFIASFGKEAQEIQQALPIGRGHVCMQTSDLPRIVRQILTMHI
jgi:von Willebrand factor A domain-containing protein 8